MTLRDDLADAKTPREAVSILVTHIEHLQARVYELEHKHDDSWDTPIDDAWSADDVAEIDKKYDHVVTIKDPGQEKWDARHLFAEQSLKLQEYAASAPLWDDKEDWEQAYAYAGPNWLYTVDRDFVMSLPRSVRQAMVADIEEDDPATAKEVGRDILKYTAQETEYSGG